MCKQINKWMNRTLSHQHLWFSCASNTGQFFQSPPLLPWALRKRTVATVKRLYDDQKLIVAKGLASKILDTSSGGDWRALWAPEPTKQKRDWQQSHAGLGLHHFWSSTQTLDHSKILWMSIRGRAICLTPNFWTFPKYPQVSLYSGPQAVRTRASCSGPAKSARRKAFWKWCRRLTRSCRPRATRPLQLGCGCDAVHPMRKVA